MLSKYQCFRLYCLNVMKISLYFIIFYINKVIYSFKVIVTQLHYFGGNVNVIHYIIKSPVIAIVMLCNDFDSNCNVINFKVIDPRSGR